MSIFCSHECMCSLSHTAHATVSASRPHSTHLLRDRVLSFHTWALLDACNEGKESIATCIAFVTCKHIATATSNYCIAQHYLYSKHKYSEHFERETCYGSYYTNNQTFPPACNPHPPTPVHRHKLCHLLSHKQHLPFSSALFISFPT